MPGGLAALAPASWLRRSPRSARLRLTLLYAGTFLLLGTGVIVIILVFSSATTTIQVKPTFKGRPPAGFHATVVRQHSADVSGLLGVSWVVLIITALASAVLGWFASGRVLRPLREMTATARTISAGNLSQRLALSGPDDEFKQLGDTFNQLLARLEAAFEAQRRFVANASHELRTPLTLERTLIQVALADPHASTATLRTACEELLQSGREQERLLEALLTLASSERGLERLEPVDLAALCGRVIIPLRSEFDRRSIELESVLGPARTNGDPALIERLVGNLLDNAVRYNRAGGRVEIRTATDNGHSTVSVVNTGPVVAPDTVEGLFEPFKRLGDDRTVSDGHHGLGLSIVRAIATAHGATLTAQALPEGGLAVTVTFEAN